MVRLLLIGQAPSRETDGQPPFVGKCGAFLATLMSTTQAEMLRDHDFLNVLDRWPGKGINGDKFPMAQATEAAGKLLDQFVGRTVILLGANVAKAFGVVGFRYLERYEVRHPANHAIVITQSCYIVPHPSGVNRIWNRTSSREAAKNFFASLIGKDREVADAPTSDSPAGTNAG